MSLLSSIESLRETSSAVASGSREWGRAIRGLLAFDIVCVCVCVCVCERERESVLGVCERDT